MSRNVLLPAAEEDLAEERLIPFWPLRDYEILFKPATNSVEILSIFRDSRDVPELARRRKL